jgi:hypothetical protein
MSERDCGSWYCQKAFGFKKLVLGEDLVMYPFPRVTSGEHEDLDEERMAITGHIGPPARPAHKPLGGWMGEQRAQGWEGWIGAYQQTGPGARHFWMWDPDSRGKYFEVRGPYKRDQVPDDIGELHRGRGWQLPLCVAMEDEPSERDLRELRQGHTPYFIIGEVDEPPVDPPDDDDEPPVEPPADCQCEGCDGTGRNKRIEAKLDYAICLIEEW